MKKFIILVLLPILFSCNNSKIEQLTAERDSILAQSDAKEKMINDFMSAFGEIEGNLATIKEKEKIIRVSASGDALSTDAKDRINEDILSIYKLMVENKENLERVQSKLKKSGLQITEFKKTIARLTGEMEKKDGELNELKSQLAKLHIDIANLNTEIAGLSTEKDSLNKANKEKSEVIDQQTTDLNTVYYVYGTKKELVEHGVANKSGIFGGVSKLSDKLNKEYFTKADLRKISSIPLSAKKASLITTHPAGSYSFSGGDKKVDALVIKDSKEFWSTSKYCVILVD